MPEKCYLSDVNIEQVWQKSQLFVATEIKPKCQKNFVNYLEAEGGVIFLTQGQVRLDILDIFPSINEIILKLQFVFTVLV